MKRKILLLAVLALAMMLVLTGCGNETKVETKTDASSTATAIQTNTNKTQKNTTSSENSTANKLTYSLKDKILTVTVKAEGLNYDNLPWVGIAPVGDYKSEEEVDEVDVTYTYVTAENYPNVELDIDGIEKGEWLVVFCDTDDGENGKILATSPITIK
ncbi:MAG: hypothetical protein IKP28_03285 [Clostridia bacterium]|nr:hypothetical protein [Clostridia bacterium]